MSLFTKPQNIDAVTTKFLSYLDKSISPDIVESELSLHPNYPSLLAISDVLLNFKIQNGAYNVNIQDLPDIPVPFIAHTNKPGSEFILITNKNNKHIFYNRGYGKDYKQEIKEFAKLFNGVVLVPDDIERLKIKATVKQRLKAFSIKSYYNIILGLLLAVVLVGLLFSTNYLTSLKWQVISLTTFKFIGVGASILLLLQSLDSNNPLIQKLCGGEGLNCNAILSSKAAKIFEGLSWSEVGFYYFTGTLLTLFYGSSSAAMLQMLAVLNVISLPYTIYSIYYQAKVAKQWCVLCCTVQALLWLEFIPLVTYFHSPFLDVNLGQVATLGCCMLFPVLLWLSLKPLLLRLQKVTPLQNQLRRFKYNTNLFNSLLKSQPKYVLPDENWSLVLGNVEADTVITMVSNPYCPPCSKVHQQLDEWLNARGDIQLRVVFTATNNDADIKTPVVRHLMALNELPDKTVVQRALHDWYNQKQKSYEAWAKAYPVILNEANYYKLDKQKAWCSLAEITATPTLMINGSRLPDGYQLHDLKYMLL